MNANGIKTILSQYRKFQCEYGLLKSQLSSPHQEERIKDLHRKLAIIQALLVGLNDEELFVVTKHIIEKLTWPLVIIEFETEWGRMQARHERTLKRIQSKALSKMLVSIEHVGMAAEIETLFGYLAS